MRFVGNTEELLPKERPTSEEAMAAVDAINRLSPGVPGEPGVFRFKSWEEKNAYDDRMLLEFMVRVAKKRGL